MRHGFRIHIALSEFVTAAALITIAACSVSYFYTKHVTEQHAAEAAACVKEPTVINHYITVPAPHIHVRVVVPKPEPHPVTDMKIEPTPEPKVWDNDNLPSAEAPPTFDPDRQPVITTALRQPRKP